MSDSARLWVGYDADADREYLVTMWPDGTGELATRRGQDNRAERWSRPIMLLPED